MQPSRTSGPVPDSAQPYTAPEVGVIETREEDEFASLAESRRWPQIVEYLRGRQEFYRKFLPDGTPIANASNEEVGQWWKCAATLIEEYDAFINIVEVRKNAVRQSRRG